MRIVEKQTKKHPRVIIALIKRCRNDDVIHNYRAIETSYSIFVKRLIAAPCLR